MASQESKVLSSCDLFNTHMNELKGIKSDLDKLKSELLSAQKKYEERLSQYEGKLEQVYDQIEQINQEQTERETNVLNATSEWLDIKSKLETSAISPKQKIILNIGGEYFETTIATLTKDDDKNVSYFKSLFSRQWELEKDPTDESIFIDRDGILFGYILQYLRTRQVAIDMDNALLRRDLITEAEFYKIDSLVNLLKVDNNNNSKSELKKIYFKSKILSPEHQQQLNKLFGNDSQQWKLVYRASRDGLTGQLFHQFCDNQCPTMTVIRSQNGCIFGGFTTVAWTSLGVDTADSSAYLFTLKNPFEIPPTKYPIQERGIRFAVCHKSTGGPTFGSVQHGGSDIFMHSPFNIGGSRIFFPQSYKDTTGKGRTTFTGDSHFFCDDFEVFTPV